MEVAVVGTGYVGLVAGVCLAELGHRVACVDVDVAKIELLRGGGVPIYEDGLHTLLPANMAAGRLSFTTDLASAASGADVVIIAVGTPPGEDGSADLKYVEGVARDVSQLLSDDAVVVVKSTVPVGTCDRIEAFLARLTGRQVPVVSNPEFLRQGVAVRDFLEPDRVVVGAANGRGMPTMRALYAPLAAKGVTIHEMDRRSSELTKYAANAMLATRISFINEMSRLCEVVGADIELVREGIGSDHRIGPAFLRAGIGYGGSCFPKDVKALQRIGVIHGVKLGVLAEVEAANARQKRHMVDVLQRDFGDVSGKRFAMWGLAFKPETDDLREAPSIPISQGLVELGASVAAWDPQAMTTARAWLGETITYATDAYEAARGADALLLVTEWKEFRDPEWGRLRELLVEPRVYDGRNLWQASEVRAKGFQYWSVGRP